MTYTPDTASKSHAEKLAALYVASTREATEAERKATALRELSKDDGRGASEAIAAVAGLRVGDVIEHSWREYSETARNLVEREGLVRVLQFAPALIEDSGKVTAVVVALLLKKDGTDRQDRKTVRVYI